MGMSESDLNEGESKQALEADRLACYTAWVDGAEQLSVILLMGLETIELCYAFPDSDDLRQFINGLRDAHAELYGNYPD